MLIALAKKNVIQWSPTQQPSKSHRMGVMLVRKPPVDHIVRQPLPVAV